MVIKGGKVLNDEFRFVEADVTIKGETIEKITTADECDIDATNCYVVPGFIDTHFHGINGEELVYPNENGLKVIAEGMAKMGTTSIVPAISAAPKDVLLNAIEVVLKQAQKQSDESANFLGIHLEGPFFSVKFKGAHHPKNIRMPDVCEFTEYVDKAKGYLKIMTMAPENDGADDVIKCATENNVCISIGHTDASMEEVLHAVDLGAKQGTHTFNAMRGLNHREPGTVGGILFSDAKAEIICDFFHVHPKMVKMVYDIKGPDKINLITDSVKYNGMPDGVYENGDLTITVKDKHPYTETGAISGSTIYLIDAVRNLVSIGIPLEDVCKMASKNPAETVGAYNYVGSIAPGKRADIVILDKELNIKNVVLRGKVIQSK